MCMLLVNDSQGRWSLQDWQIHTTWLLVQTIFWCNSTWQQRNPPRNEDYRSSWVNVHFTVSFTWQYHRCFIHEEFVLFPLVSKWLVVYSSHQDITCGNVSLNSVCVLACCLPLPCCDVCAIEASSVGGCDPETCLVTLLSSSANLSLSWCGSVSVDGTAS